MKVEVFGLVTRVGSFPFAPRRRIVVGTEIFSSRYARPGFECAFDAGEPQHLNYHATNKVLHEGCRPGEEANIHIGPVTKGRKEVCSSSCRKCGFLDALTNVLACQHAQHTCASS
ncbi:unnamed protein product [Scytosiphon promiscuus]